MDEEGLIPRMDGTICQAYLSHYYFKVESSVLMHRKKLQPSLGTTTLSMFLFGYDN